MVRDIPKQAPIKVVERPRKAQPVGEPGGGGGMTIYDGLQAVGRQGRHIRRKSRPGVELSINDFDATDWEVC